MNLMRLNGGVILALAMIAFIFAADCLTPLGFAVWVCYLFPMLIVSWTASRRAVSILAAISVLLIIAGYFTSPPGIETQFAVVNRTMGIIVIVITTILTVERQVAERKLQQQAKELQDTNEKLQDQAQELELQAAELQQQAEELEIQTEEMQTQNDEMMRIQNELREARDKLEQRVRERTHELAKANQEMAHQTDELKELANLLENTHDAILIRDMNAHIRFWNGGAERRYGYNREQALGRRSHDLLQTEFPQPLRQIYAELAEKGYWEGDLVHQRRDGTTVIVNSRWALQRDGNGQPLAVLEINNDITEKRTTEQALRRNEALLRQVFDTLPVGVWITDKEGAILSSNPAGMRIWAGAQYVKPEPPGEHKGWWVKTGEPIAAQDWALARAVRCGETSIGEEIEIECLDKTHKFVLNSAAPLMDDKGEITGAIAVNEDITERRRAEDEVRRLNAELEQRVLDRTAQLEASNRELEAFAYTVSHDLRAPLRAMDGFSRILIEEHASEMPAEASRLLHSVRRNAVKMGQLIDDLLAFSRMGRQPVAKRSVSMKALVQQALEDLRADLQGRQIEIVLPELPRCEADPPLLKQVWLNLLSNALKFTQDQEKPRIEIGSQPGDSPDRQVFFIRDNGIGFDMQYVDKLFGVFQRLHRSDEYEGTGVGLAIVQRIIQRHGGRAWAEGKPGEGATFYFTLPCTSK